MEQARRDLMQADEKLAQKREEEKKNREVMDAKWEDLRTKEILLKESFISFNKVICQGSTQTGYRSQPPVALRAPHCFVPRQ